MAAPGLLSLLPPELLDKIASYLSWGERSLLTTSCPLLQPLISPLERLGPSYFCQEYNSCWRLEVTCASSLQGISLHFDLLEDWRREDTHLQVD